MVFDEYVKIERLGNPRTTSLLLARPEDEIYIEEKVDGACFRFMPYDGRVIFGSHHSSLGDDSMDIGGHWRRCVDFLKQKLEGKDLTPYNGLIFFGECCIPHSIQYDWDKIPPFLGFDVMQNGVYLPYKEKIRLFAELELPVVPLVNKTTAAELIEKPVLESNIPQSLYGAIQAEGLVFKNYRTQTFLKFVTSRFKEVNKKVFGSAGNRLDNDDERLIKIYCTNPRIDKQIFELVLEGEVLDMPLMQQLPRRVWNDILVEDGYDILMENWKLDLRNCRKLVANRCRAVLELAIANQMVQAKPLEV